MEIYKTMVFLFLKLRNSDFPKKNKVFHSNKQVLWENLLIILLKTTNTENQQNQRIRG
jgi:hypothetical protein